MIIQSTIPSMKPENGPGGLPGLTVATGVTRY